MFVGCFIIVITHINMAVTVLLVGIGLGYQYTDTRFIEVISPEIRGLIVGFYNADSADAITLHTLTVMMGDFGYYIGESGKFMILIGFLSLFATIITLMALLARSNTVSILGFLIMLVVTSIGLFYAVTLSIEVRYVDNYILDSMKKIFKNQFNNYRGADEVNMDFKIMTQLQLRLGCCGAENFRDWENLTTYMKQPLYGTGANSIEVPFHPSCCKYSPITWSPINYQSCYSDLKEMDYLRNIHTGCAKILGGIMKRISTVLVYLFSIFVTILFFNNLATFILFNVVPKGNFIRLVTEKRRLAIIKEKIKCGEGNFQELPADEAGYKKIFRVIARKQRANRGPKSRESIMKFIDKFDRKKSFLRA